MSGTNVRSMEVSNKESGKSTPPSLHEQHSRMPTSAGLPALVMYNIKITKPGIQLPSQHYLLRRPQCLISAMSCVWTCGMPIQSKGWDHVPKPLHIFKLYIRDYRQSHTPAIGAASLAMQQHGPSAKRRRSHRLKFSPRLLDAPSASHPQTLSRMPRPTRISGRCCCCPDPHLHSAGVHSCAPEAGETWLSAQTGSPQQMGS